MQIRPIQIGDAEQFMQLRQQLDQETQFMLLEPGERSPVLLSEQQAWLAAWLNNPQQVILVAEAQGQLVGYLEARGGAFKRNEHCATLVIGILQAFSGQGVGTQLVAALEAWAREHGIWRLELTVMTHNQPALGLYRKLGFTIEGTRQQSLWIDEQAQDEYYMARLLHRTLPLV